MPTPRPLPVAPPLDALLPRGGLRRGEAVAVVGSASLALALLARPTREGAWGAVVGMPSLGLAAAREAGIRLDRLVLVPSPGARWPEVVAALVDAVEVVALRPPPRLGHTVARQLEARVRQRGGVLLTLHADATTVPTRTPLRLTIVGHRWEGLGEGHGHLRAHHLDVRVEGHGAAARPRTHHLVLHGPVGPEVAGTGHLGTARTGTGHLGAADLGAAASDGTAAAPLGPDVAAIAEVG